MQIPTKRVRVKASGHEVTINVSDFNPEIHAELGEAAGNFDETPGAISTVNVGQALGLIAEAEDGAALDALEAAEKASVKNEGGRKSVLKAIDARRAELEE